MAERQGYTHVEEQVNDRSRQEEASEKQTLRLVRITAPDERTLDESKQAIKDLCYGFEFAEPTGNAIAGNPSWEGKSLFVNVATSNDFQELQGIFQDAAKLLPGNGWNGWEAAYFDMDTETNEVIEEHPIDLPLVYIEKDDGVDALAIAEAPVGDGASGNSPDGDDGAGFGEDEFTGEPAFDEDGVQAEHRASVDEEPISDSTGEKETGADENADGGFEAEAKSDEEPEPHPETESEPVSEYGLETDEGGYEYNDAGADDTAGQGGMEDPDVFGGVGAEDEYADYGYDDDFYGDEEDEVERAQRLEREARQQERDAANGRAALEPLALQDAPSLDDSADLSDLELVSTLDLNPSALAGDTLPEFAPTEASEALKRAVEVDVIAPTQDELLAVLPAVGLNSEDDALAGAGQRGRGDEDNDVMLGYLDESMHLVETYANDRSVVRGMDKSTYKKVQGWAIDLISKVEPKRLRKLDVSRSEMVASLDNTASAIQEVRNDYLAGLKEAMAVAAMEAAHDYSAANRAAIVGACDETLSEETNAVAKQLANHAIRAYEALIYAEKQIEDEDEAKDLLGHDVDRSALRAYLSAARYRVMSDKALAKLVATITEPALDEALAPSESMYGEAVDDAQYRGDYQNEVAPDGSFGGQAAANAAPMPLVAAAQVDSGLASEGNNEALMPADGAQEPDAPSNVQAVAEAAIPMTPVQLDAAGEAGEDYGADLEEPPSSKANQGSFYAEQSNQEFDDDLFGLDNGSAEAILGDEVDDVFAADGDADDVFAAAEEEEGLFHDEDGDADDFFDDGESGSKKKKRSRSRKEKKAKSDDGSGDGKKGKSSKTPIIIGVALTAALLAGALGLMTCSKGGGEQAGSVESETDSHGLYQVGEQYSADANGKRIAVTLIGFKDSTDDAEDRIIARDEDGQEYEITYEQMAAIAGAKGSSSSSQKEESETSSSQSNPVKGSSANDTDEGNSTSGDSATSDSESSSQQDADNSDETEQSSQTKDADANAQGDASQDVSEGSDEVQNPTAVPNGAAVNGPVDGEADAEIPRTGR